jgi:hypothetical protein
MGDNDQEKDSDRKEFGNNIRSTLVVSFSKTISKNLAKTYSPYFHLTIHLVKISSLYFGTLQHSSQIFYLYTLLPPVCLCWVRLLIVVCGACLPIRWKLVSAAARPHTPAVAHPRPHAWWPLAPLHAPVLLLHAAGGRAAAGGARFEAPEVDSRPVEIDSRCRRLMCGQRSLICGVRYRLIRSAMLNSSGPTSGAPAVAGSSARGSNGAPGASGGRAGAARYICVAKRSGYLAG